MRAVTAIAREGTRPVRGREDLGDDLDLTASELGSGGGVRSSAQPSDTMRPAAGAAAMTVVVEPVLPPPKTHLLLLPGPPTCKVGYPGPSWATASAG